MQWLRKAIAAVKAEWVRYRAARKLRETLEAMRKVKREADRYEP